MGESVILTGGYYSSTKVTELRMDGSYTELPALNQGRYSHGCASYLDDYGNKVIILSRNPTFNEKFEKLKGFVSCWWKQLFLH